MAAAEVDQPYRLACLELHGGNRAGAYSAELPGLSSWVSCRPLVPSQRGGDLYYLSTCSRGVIARVVLADVSGHGEVVSAAAVRLAEALRAHVDHWDQSTLIRQLNESFLQCTPSSRFATAFLASYYRESGELLFTNAGHMPPLWYRASERQWSFLQDSTPYSKEINDLPLGLIPGTSYSQTAVQLQHGDLLLLYTDGISESCDPGGEQLGMEGLLEIANGLPVESAEAAGKALIAGVNRFRRDVLPADDETVVVLARNGAMQ